MSHYMCYPGNNLEISGNTTKKKIWMVSPKVVRTEYLPNTGLQPAATLTCCFSGQN
jgi:hypothetical protein